MYIYVHENSKTQQVLCSSYMLVYYNVCIGQR